jgi:conjugative transfer signal peptidase TraF
MCVTCDQRECHSSVPQTVLKALAFTARKSVEGRLREAAPCTQRPCVARPRGRLAGCGFALLSGKSTASGGAGTSCGPVVIRAFPVRKPAVISRSMDGRTRARRVARWTALGKSRVLFALTALGLILLGTSALSGIPLRLIWNVSASMPRGLYWVQPGKRPKRGDTVIAWLPNGVRELAAARHYLPTGIPLVKRVKASAGDRVCASGRRILINGKMAAVRYSFDPAGRTLPWWNGCRRLAPDEVFLLTAPARSFDGRYFGISARRELVGRAVPIWLL